MINRTAFVGACALALSLGWGGVAQAQDTTQEVSALELPSAELSGATHELETELETLNKNKGRRGRGDKGLPGRPVRRPGRGGDNNRGRPRPPQRPVKPVRPKPPRRPGKPVRPKTPRPPVKPRPPLRPRPPVRPRPPHHPGRPGWPDRPGRPGWPDRPGRPWPGRPDDDWDNDRHEMRRMAGIIRDTPSARRPLLFFLREVDAMPSFDFDEDEWRRIERRSGGLPRRGVLGALFKGADEFERFVSRYTIRRDWRETAYVRDMELELSSWTRFRLRREGRGEWTIDDISGIRIANQRFMSIRLEKIRVRATEDGLRIRFVGSGGFSREIERRSRGFDDRFDDWGHDRRDDVDVGDVVRGIVDLLD